MEGARVELQSQSVIGISDAEEAQILEWIAELEGPCSSSRQVVLATQLSHALEGFMGIDKELLTHSFLLAQTQRSAAEAHGNAVSAARDATEARTPRTLIATTQRVPE